MEQVDSSSSAATSTASSEANAHPLHNSHNLQTFSGSALEHLTELGVSEVAAADVEQGLWAQSGQQPQVTSSSAKRPRNKIKKKQPPPVQQKNDDSKEEGEIDDGTQESKLVGGIDLLGTQANADETTEQKLIRTGEITPFHHVAGVERSFHRLPSTPTHRSTAPSTTTSSSPPSALSSEFVPSETEIEEMDSDDESSRTAVNNKKRRSRHSRSLIDDADDSAYKRRIREMKESTTDSNGEAPSDVAFEGGLVMPGRVWDRLFKYQRTSIKWLWELHCQNTGGIVADEMGLGKTIQIIAFLAGLHYTKQLQATSSSSSSSSSDRITLGPVLIVCPATIMAQWLHEFRAWYPEMRVMLMHESGNHAMSHEQLVNTVLEQSSVLITTYESLRIYQHLLLHCEWGYVVLDEGHKIRNPDAEISLVCKQLLTVHRLILTGSPIQNNLVELWSLFDFVFPGKLGTLPVFEEEFCIPIQQGGYLNASKHQVQVAFKCAMVLRDLINPYILRRTKANVAKHLPEKTEHVLFCNLAEEQRNAYVEFLNSKEVRAILAGRSTLFKAIHYLRALCNHPDLLLLQKQKGTSITERPSNVPDYGNFERSGKMKVVREVLKLWHQQGHRALVFTQTRAMLDIIQDFVVAQGYEFRRLDGVTTISKRIPMIDEFNQDPNIFIMLLTTRAGGIGVNLTGADRVLLFDPDWNPSVDSQAKERSYRIGQSKNVTVYRLITRGTIEEKVYHRQIYKQFLTNKILKDPQQRRFFSQKDMRELLSLGKEYGGSETLSIFADQEIEVDPSASAKGSSDQDLEHKEIASSSKASSPLETTTMSKSRKRKASKNESKDQKSATKRPKKHIKKSASSELTHQGDSRSRPEASIKNDDDYILSVLFQSSDGSVHSALSHDRIIESSSQDATMSRSHADEAAKRAVAALKRSQQSMRRSAINEPTWTGLSGSAGVFEYAPSRSRFGGASTAQGNGSSSGNGNSVPSSASVLQRIRNRAATSGDDATDTSAASSNSSSSDRANLQLLRELTECLSSHPEGMSSEAIIHTFSSKLGAHEGQAMLFRQMLRRVATLKSSRHGRVWCLKPTALAPVGVIPPKSDAVGRLRQLN